MKKNKETILKFIILSIILMLLGCSDDLFDTQINKSNIKIRRISMNDAKFKENHLLMKSVEKFFKNESDHSLNRFEYGNEYDFYIDEEDGIYLEKNNLESYTFPAYKNKTDSLVTNIVFNKTTSGEYEVILAKYNLLKTDLNNLTKEKLTASNVQYINISNKFSTPELVCIEEYSYENTGELVGADSEPFFEWIITGSYCFWSNSTGGGGGDSGDGGGNTSNNGGEILTGPHGGGGGLISELQDDSPCANLKKLTTTVSVKVALKNLKDNKLNKNEEFGYSVSTFPNSTNIAPPAVLLPNPNDGHAIPFPRGGNIVGAFHVHTITGSLMFSHEDFRSLAVIANNNNNNLDYSAFFVTLTTNDGTFAIMIDDFATFFDAMRGLKYLKFHKELEDKYINEGLPSTSINYQKILLKAMSKHNIGASLYTANTDLSGWNKLSLDPVNPNNNQVPTPCE